MTLCKSSRFPHDRFRTASLLTAAVAVLTAGSSVVRSAETLDSAPPAKTVLVLKVGTDEPLTVRSAFHAQPPTLTLTFPGEQVIGSLPERSAISKGVIQTIVAHYAPQANPNAPRTIRSVQIGLSGPYAPSVRSEPGQVIVEIEHPASVSGSSFEIGVQGGTIIEGIGDHRVSDRFRAMQEAMARMTPTPWALQITDASPPVSNAPAPQRRTSASEEKAAAPASPAPQGSAVGSWGLLAAILLGAGLAWRYRTAWKRNPMAQDAQAPRVPSGVLLIDQLVWKTFERQGYQMAQELDLTPPLGGPLRVLAKDGRKSALLFVGNGPFFEKQTVERFVRAMQAVQVEQGTLVASGSFTVPAQRFAKDRGVTLIGRDELIGLLSAGAGTEYLAKQIEQQQLRVTEAAESLRQYAAELDALRRQRNDASWQLGEERAKSAQLEARIGELTEQLRGHDNELKRWERDASMLRKQWEESQWYLGESRNRMKHLATQIAGLQERAQQAEFAGLERDAAAKALEEARAKGRTLDTALVELQQTVETLSGRERALQESLARLTQELGTLRKFGERRRGSRRQIPGALVELRNGKKTPFFVGPVRDLSLGGFGLESEQELPSIPSIKVHLTLPGSERFESGAKLVWQQSGRVGYQSGYRLTGAPPAFRARLEELIETSGPA